VSTRDDVVVSTLPATAAEAVAATVPAAHHGILLDVGYDGWPTPPARAAAAAGMTVVSGLDMLVHQAAEQFRLFTGHDAPVAEMAAAGRAALARR
jgi:shikimate dehydrogenase